MTTPFILFLSTAIASAAAAEPAGFTMDRIGAVTDFDYFRGGWETVQHRLAGDVRSPASKWEDFPGRLCMQPYLEGHATVDELFFPTRGSAGLTLRTFDHERRQWSIYWVSGASGRLDPVPVVGGFHGNRGEFYAMDQADGQPVRVRYLWIIKDRDHARWEQALAFDDGVWRTNWTADFTRADTAKICSEGRPIR